MWFKIFYLHLPVCKVVFMNDCAATTLFRNFQLLNFHPITSKKKFFKITSCILIFLEDKNQHPYFAAGEMAERFKAAVLKTVDPKGPGVRIPLSPLNSVSNILKGL